MPGLSLEQRAKNLEKALAWIYSDTNIGGDKPTGKAQLNFRKLYEKAKSAGGAEKVPWTSGPQGPLAELETRIMNSYSQASRQSRLTKAERGAVTAAKIKWDEENPPPTVEKVKSGEDEAGNPIYKEVPLQTKNGKLTKKAKKTKTYLDWKKARDKKEYSNYRQEFYDTLGQEID